MVKTPRWLNDDEQQLWRLMLAASRNVNRVLDETLQSGSDLSSAEFSVLVSLSEAEDTQMRLRDLCLSLTWDRSRASHQVTRMEKRGLLTKSKSPDDARGVMIKLTSDGMTRVRQAAPEHVESVRRMVFDHLRGEDIPALKRFLQDIVNVDTVPTARPAARPSDSPAPHESLRETGKMPLT